MEKSWSRQFKGKGCANIVFSGRKCFIDLLHIFSKMCYSKETGSSPVVISSSTHSQILIITLSSLLHSQPFSGNDRPGAYSVSVPYYFHLKIQKKRQKKVLNQKLKIAFRKYRGAPGWLSWLSVGLQLRS